MDTPVKAFPVLSIINGLSRYHDKHYCYPSQETFIKLLIKRQGVYMSIATLNRWLRVVEDAGYLKRCRRIRNDDKLGMVFNTTIYYMTLRGYLLLGRLGVAVWGKVKELAAEIRKKAVPVSNKEEKVIKPYSLDWYKDLNIRESMKEYLK